MPSRFASPRVFAAAGCVLALAACGSSHTSTSPTGPPKNALAFASCMRSHGVSDFPDPTTGGSGFAFKLTAGVNPGSPAFRSARLACRHYLPGAITNPHPSEAAQMSMLAFAKCLRGHGLTNVPDPTVTPPNPGSGDVIGRDGVFLSLPGGTARSPAFQQAAKACGFGPP